MDVNKYAVSRTSGIGDSYYTATYVLTDCQWAGYKEVESENYGTQKVPYILLNFSRLKKDRTVHNQMRQIRFTMTETGEFNKFFTAYNGSPFILSSGVKFGEDERREFCKDLQTEIRNNNFNFKIRWSKDEDTVGVYKTVWKIFSIEKVDCSIKKIPEFIWDKKAVHKYPILEFNNASLRRLYAKIPDIDDSNDGSNDDFDSDDSISESVGGL